MKQFANGQLDITLIALARFCEDLGTKLDLEAPSHSLAVEKFRENMALLKAGKSL